MLGWDEIGALAADPLVAIGAHSKAHYEISKLAPEKALSEMAGSADIIEEKLGRRPVHFSFPYGDETAARARDFALAKEAGFKTAVTTRRACCFRRIGASDGAAAGPACRRLSVADLYGALSLWRDLCVPQSLPAGQRRLSSIVLLNLRPLHPTDQQARRHYPGKPGDEEKGELGKRGVAVVMRPGADARHTSA